MDFDPGYEYLDLISRGMGFISRGMGGSLTPGRSLREESSLFVRGHTVTTDPGEHAQNPICVEEYAAGDVQFLGSQIAAHANAGFKSEDDEDAADSADAADDGDDEDDEDDEDNQFPIDYDGDTPMSDADANGKSILE